MFFQRVRVGEHIGELASGDRKVVQIGAACHLHRSEIIDIAVALKAIAEQIVKLVGCLQQGVLDGRAGAVALVVDQERQVAGPKVPGHIGMFQRIGDGQDAQVIGGLVRPAVGDSGDRPVGHHPAGPVGAWTAVAVHLQAVAGVLGAFETDRSDLDGQDLAAERAEQGFDQQGADAGPACLVARGALIVLLSPRQPGQAPVGHRGFVAEKQIGLHDDFLH